MIKLVVFDLDKTLAELGKGVTPENIKQLKQLEEKLNKNLYKIWLLNKS